VLFIFEISTFLVFVYGFFFFVFFFFSLFFFFCFHPVFFFVFSIDPKKIFSLLFSFFFSPLVSRDGASSPPSPGFFGTRGAAGCGVWG
jgi:hypothetical protein